MRIIVAITSTLLFVATAGADVLMDAAELDRNGAALEFASVRPVVDNAKGLTDMTGVRFRINYTGTLGGIGGYAWDDPANPWYGAPGGRGSQVVGGKRYTQGIVFYPQTDQWGAHFSVDPTPADPTDWENNYELSDVVPAGVRWDRPVKLMGWLGSEIKLFHSPAEGVLTADGSDTIFYDDNRLPQTAVPEPATLILLAIGAVLIRPSRRQKSRK